MAHQSWLLSLLSVGTGLLALASCAQAATPNPYDTLDIAAVTAPLSTPLDERPKQDAATEESPGVVVDSSILLANVPWDCDPEKPAITYPTIKINGFFQADAGWFNQDATSIAAVTDVQDGADFRRARLSASGDVAENIHYMMEYDFAQPGRPNFTDIYLDIDDFLGPGNFRLGQWRSPMGLDALTGVKDLTFLERSLPFAFLPFRQIAVGKYHGTDDGAGTWALSAIRFPTDAYGGNVGDNGGYGVVGRVSYVPFENNDSSELLHVGGSFAFIDPANDQVRYRTQPEFFVGETGGADILPIGVPSSVPPFVDTNAIDTQNVQIFGTELAMVYHSLHMESEAIFTNVNRITGDNVSFWGASAQVGYFLTGEVRPYNHKAGVMGKVTPLNPYKRCSGFGALEIVARLSTIDLNDGDVAGGRLTDLTGGVNWYLHRNLKFQMNYIHAFLDSPGFGDSDTDIVALRAQLEF